MRMLELVRPLGIKSLADKLGLGLLEVARDTCSPLLFTQ